MFDGQNKRTVDDDFWNLDEFVKKGTPRGNCTQKHFSRESTSSVEIEVPYENSNTTARFSDISLSQRDMNENTTITRFIPPRNDSVFAEKHVLFEYSPENPLIKSVKICSNKPDDSLFVQDNLFIRERRAYLNKTVGEQPYVSYYSYSPRYSNMSRAQLKWYLWWRENARNGIFLKTDESYIVLFVYELAATGDNEDKEKALDMLCTILENYSEKDINVVIRMMIRDVICDFCLIHALPSPIQKLSGLDRQLLSSAPLPELFVDLSENNKMKSAGFICSNLSLYDYKRSKLYTDENADLFKKAIGGALLDMISNAQAFGAITSFTEGMYGCITSERKPFTRMVNIVNRNVKIEITYYQLSNLQNPITDAVRYSENKLREHIGSKSKLHILSINPHVQRTIDVYFEKNYPPLPVYDRRRRAAKAEDEVNEYEKLYDVPKTEISPQRALEIEQESWNTTKILTEAFSDEYTVDHPPSDNNDFKDNHCEYVTPTLDASTISTDIPAEVDPGISSNASQVFLQIKNILGKKADFITLCFDRSLHEQRHFASSLGFSTDELADMINETAVDIFGDIILDNDGGAYRIIDDYTDIFNN